MVVIHTIDAPKVNEQKHSLKHTLEKRKPGGMNGETKRTDIDTKSKSIAGHAKNPDVLLTGRTIGTEGVRIENIFE